MHELGLYGYQGLHYNVVDLGLQDRHIHSLLLQPLINNLKTSLAAGLILNIIGSLEKLALLIDSIICQVDEIIGKVVFSDILIVVYCCESSDSFLVEIDPERSARGYQDVES